MGGDHDSAPLPLSDALIRVAYALIDTDRIHLLTTDNLSLYRGQFPCLRKLSLTG